MSMTSEERGDGGIAEPFAPANIVRLRRPYKVGDWWGERPPGFSDSGEGLHLYDPAHALLYIHDCYTVPAYVDFHVSELAPHKVATDDGYATLPALDNEGA